MMRRRWSSPALFVVVAAVLAVARPAWLFPHAHGPDGAHLHANSACSGASAAVETVHYHGHSHADTCSHSRSAGLHCHGSQEHAAHRVSDDGIGAGCTPCCESHHSHAPCDCSIMLAVAARSGTRLPSAWCPEQSPDQFWAVAGGPGASQSQRPHLLAPPWPGGGEALRAPPELLAIRSVVLRL